MSAPTLPQTIRPTPPPTTPPTTPPTALIDATQRTVYGEWSAFTAALARLRGYITRRAKKLAFNDADLADDLEQQAWIRLWELDPSRYDPHNARDERYLRSALVHRMRNCVRDEQMLVFEQMAMTPADSVPDPVPDPVRDPAGDGIAIPADYPHEVSFRTPSGFAYGPYSCRYEGRLIHIPRGSRPWPEMLDVATVTLGLESQLQLRVLATERSTTGTRVHVAGFGALAMPPKKSER